MSHRASYAAVVAGLIVSTLSACGHLPARNAEASWSKSYSTLRGLDRDSSMVAMVRVTGPGHPRADDVEDAGIDTTAHYAAEVVQAIHGTASGTLQLMLDTSDQVGAEFPDPLETGHEYVLFLMPFEWHRGHPTGDWIVTGETGIYEVGDNGLDLVPGGAGEGLPTHFADVDALTADL
jgi:hypothetical protein